MSLRTPITSLIAGSARSTRSITTHHLPRYAVARRSLTTSSPLPESSSKVTLKAHDPSILSTKSGVLSPNGFERIEEWQTGLWNRLEEEMKNQPAIQAELASNIAHSQSLDLVKLLAFLARDPSLSLAFNYASLILNNSFFLQNMSSTPQEIPERFSHLHPHLVGKARGTVGSGWLWLVKSDKGTYEIIPTYGSSTLLVRNSVYLASSSATPYRPASLASRDSLPIPSSPKLPQNRPNDVPTTIKPLAVCSLFEHAYMEKYGVWGKEEYVRDWWRTLDWQRID